PMSRKATRRAPAEGARSARDGAARDWCCDWLRLAWERRHDPSIYVYAEPPDEYRDEATYWVAMRAVGQQHLGGDIGVTAVPLTISASYPIDFCPGCGVNLEKFYGEGYRRLVEKEIVLEHNALRRR
ncbi:MAG TPA: hypothetical protein VF754_00030, partial [Pyrinomonadaceae bacterium]